MAADLIFVSDMDLPVRVRCCVILSPLLNRAWVCRRAVGQKAADAEADLLVCPRFEESTGVVSMQEIPQTSQINDVTPMSLPLTAIQQSFWCERPLPRHHPVNLMPVGKFPGISV